MDKLDELFKLQEELNDKVFAKQDIRHANPSSSVANVLTTKWIRERVGREEFGPNDLPNQWLRNYLRALQEEGKELEADLLWKWWSKDKIDMQNIRVEIVDMLHFLISLALAAGLSAEDLHRLYTQKHTVNQMRQDQGYSKETKNEADNKSIQ